MRSAVYLDVENLVGFFSAQFSWASGERESFELYDGSAPLNLQRIVDILATHTVVTFNGNNYDLPVLVLALYGADHRALKEAGDAIIQRGLKYWEFYRTYRIQLPDYIDHVDLFDVAPGVRLSLKIYAGRMHAPMMQDLPVDPMIPVPPFLFPRIVDYCWNDHAVTQQLDDELHERMALRLALSERYGVDLRSKSDAQIAEAVIKARILKRWKDNPREVYRTITTGGDIYGPHLETVKVLESPDRIEKRYIQHGYSFKYEPPEYLRFATPQMKAVFEDVRNADFVVNDKDEAILLYGDENVKTGVQLPDVLKGRDIFIAGKAYRMGIGGLHSQESCVGYYADDEYELWDVDVASYYPSLILSLGMYPEQLGPEFLEEYGAIKVERLDDKEKAKLYETNLHYLDGDDKEECRQLYVRAKNSEGGLKIVLNGTFGKLWNKHSIFYAPELGIRVTLTGQLALLMLIEQMEMAGINVLSANTDGIVLRVPKRLAVIAKSNVAWWEKTTGLQMEYTHYRSIHFRDVNNYVAITTDGKAKRKGVYGQGGLLAGPAGKNPDADICCDAVVEYLLNGTDVASTIAQCNDIRKFIIVRAVTGGGKFLPPLSMCRGPGQGIDFAQAAEGKYLGKAVRWYYSHDGGTIVYAKTGKQVGGATHCMECMVLPDSLPSDVNHYEYTEDALLMLGDCGVPIKHWYHAESESVYTTVARDLRDYYCDGSQVMEIDRTMYDKMRKR